MVIQWRSLWTSFHRYVDHLIDTVSATWHDATEGRSYLADYSGLSLEEILALAEVKILPLEKHCRYVIASDHHRKSPRWIGKGPDLPQVTAHRLLYEQALRYYAAYGYTLIEAGDMEELWRLSPFATNWVSAWERIEEAYAPVYRIIRERFVQQGRYVRLWGNHDGVWRLAKYRHDYLGAVLGSDEIHEMALIGGQYLVMHGHAVDRWNNDRNGWFLGRILSMTPIHIDAINSVVADPDGTYPNFIGGHHRNDWLSRVQDAPWMRQLLGSARFHLFRAVECDRLYLEWARNLGLTLVCGHTHEPALFPLDDEGRATPYINCGSGVAATELQMVEIQDDGSPLAIRWTDRGREPIRFRPATLPIHDMAASVGQEDRRSTGD